MSFLSASIPLSVRIFVPHNLDPIQLSVKIYYTPDAVYGGIMIPYVPQKRMSELYNYVHTMRYETLFRTRKFHVS
jgi:hypothetical protein